MSSILLSSISGRFNLFNVLILFVTLCTINCRSFIIHGNSYYISNYITKTVPSNQILYSDRLNLKCNNIPSHLENTHPLKHERNFSEYESFNHIDENPSNVLALLSDFDKKINILNELSKLIKENQIDTKLLYITSSEQEVLDVFETLNQTDFKNKLNLISPSITQISKDTNVTLADSSTLLGYYNYYNNDVPFNHPKNVIYNNKNLKNKSSIRFETFLKSIIGNFLMSNEEISNEKPIYNPNISVNKEFLISIRNWTDKNYIESEDLIKHIKSFHKKKGIVICDNFDLFYDSTAHSLNYYFNDTLVALINKNCSFVGLSNFIYNPREISGWLSSIFGPFKLVSMSKSPEFQILTRYGYLNPFVESNEPDCINLDRLKPEDIMDSYKYLNKKSNLVNMKKINPDLKDVFVTSLEHSLKEMGLNTYNKLLHHSTAVRDIFKGYVKKLRLSPNFEKSQNKITSLLSKIINLGNNNMLSKLSRIVPLNRLVRIYHKPSVEYLINYIREKNLYPTVIYQFNRSLTGIFENFLLYSRNNSYREFNFNYDQNFYFDKNFDRSDYLTFIQNMEENRRKLFEKGICVLMNTDDDKFKRFVIKNLKKFKIILSNTHIQTAPHYIFLDTHLVYGSRILFYSNNQIYSYTQGAKLVSFTFDLKFTIHAIKSILLPIYTNYNNFKNNPPLFYKQNDVLNSRLFSSYLESCKNKYQEEEPDHFQRKEYHDKLDNYFKESNLSIEELYKMEKSNKRLSTYFEVIGNSISSKLHNKNEIINILNDQINLEGSTVIGLDGSEYKVLYSNKDIKQNLKFPNKEDENVINKFLYELEGRKFILENTELNECILAESKFIKDIIKLEKKVDSKFEPIVVNSLKYFKIKIYNDIQRLINIPDLYANLIYINCKNSLKRIYLSTILPEHIRSGIFSKIRKYNYNMRNIMEIYKKSNINKELSEKIFNNTEKGIETLSKEFIKLKGDLKRDKMEHILKRNRIINSFWGK